MENNWLFEPEERAEPQAEPAAAVRSDGMRGIGLWSPWAELVAIGAKRYETRGYDTKYRGWLAIQATMHSPAWCLKLVREDAIFNEAMTGVSVVPGAIVALVKVAQCISTNRIEVDHGATVPCAMGGGWWLFPGREMHFGNYAPNRYAWELVDLRRVDPPIPCKGKQGIWSVPPAIEEILTSFL